MSDSMPGMTRWSTRREVVVLGGALTLMCLGSAVLGWLLALVAGFRALYAAAGMKIPVLVDIAGGHPWALLGVLVPSEVTFALLACRSRRPGLWLTVEALTLAGLALALMWGFKGSVYRAMYDLNAVLRSSK